MMGYYWNNWNSPMGSWGGFGLGWIFMAIFCVFFILAIVVLVRYLVGNNNIDKGNSSLEILKDRYAKGDIDKKEFEDKKKDLS